jgi:hypothetical protein
MISGGGGRVGRLFISQEQMDRWSSAGKVTLEDDVMHLPALGRSFRLRSAVHFTGTVSDGADEHSLVGRVKTDQQLEQIGAEHIGASVLLGEVAYQCEEGFVGVPVDGSTGSSGASGLLKLGD